MEKIIKMAIRSRLPGWSLTLGFTAGAEPIKFQMPCLYIVCYSNQILCDFSFVAAPNNMGTASESSVEFLEGIFNLMVKECLTEGSKQDNKVVEFLPPDKLKVRL